MKSLPGCYALTIGWWWRWQYFINCLTCRELFWIVWTVTCLSAVGRTYSISPMGANSLKRPRFISFKYIVLCGIWEERVFFFYCSAIASKHSLRIVAAATTTGKTTQFTPAGQIAMFFTIVQVYEKYNGEINQQPFFKCVSEHCDIG